MESFSVQIVSTGLLMFLLTDPRKITRRTIQLSLGLSSLGLVLFWLFHV